MKKIDLLVLLLGCTAVLIIVWPIFNAEYLYTDEAPQFWLAPNRADRTFVVQGRYITQWLLFWLYNSEHTVKGLIHVRLFALAGWLVCIPLWYFILKRSVLQNNLPFVLAPLSVFYLISIPAFSLSIGWIACLQLFLANSTGILAGYLAYAGIESSNKKNRAWLLTFAILFGLVSLFSYQSGFGCFYIPFLIQLLAKRKPTKTVYAGFAFSVFMFGLYFLLFKWGLHLMGLSSDERTSLSFNPINKLVFLFTRPMAAAFHFTWFFNEKSLMGLILYGVEAFVFLLFSFRQLKEQSPLQKAIYYLALAGFFGGIYLPSLVVNENYASNRTLLALNMAVFFVVAVLVFSFVKAQQKQWQLATAIAVLFVANACYNFRVQFISPIIAEYNMVKGFVLANYKPTIDTINFIRPSEDAFEKKFHVVASWDEFGVPSTAKPWTPEFLLRQIITDHTGNRPIAEKLVINNYASMKAYQQAGKKAGDQTILVNVGEMMGTP
ncbi:MAG: hypothetical protein QM726_22990 [Chitinophagaceae bacterium]